MAFDFSRSVFQAPMKPTGTRISVTLACSICGERNYKTTKALRAGEPSLEMKKHCKICNKHTVHKETK